MNDIQYVAYQLEVANLLKIIEIDMKSIGWVKEDPLFEKFMETLADIVQYMEKTKKEYEKHKSDVERAKNEAYEFSVLTDQDVNTALSEEFQSNLDSVIEKLKENEKIHSSYLK